MNIKPISMKCSQEQFDKIRPMLEKNGIIGTRYPFSHFGYDSYLTNNYMGLEGDINNVSEHGKRGHKREVFEEWNQDIFLEYCGIEAKVEIRPIAMKCSSDQFKQIQPILVDNGLTIKSISHGNWFIYEYLINNLGTENGTVSNVNEYDKGAFGRKVFEEWNQDIFLEYCGIKKNKKNMGYKTTVPITDVLKIHAIACDSWKKIIVDKYLLRVDSKQNITFTESEIDEMFDAATTGQIPVLREIFGEKKKSIDWDRLKTGSKVKIKCTEQHCDGITAIDENEPVNIVFYKTPHFILSCNVFKSKGRYNSYITFNQKGRMVLFSAHLEIDYITEVIEY